MFSTNLKRSIATLGVVAGLLAAAGPAGAQGGGAGFTQGPQHPTQGVMGDVPTQTVPLIKGAAFRGEVTGLEPY